MNIKQLYLFTTHPRRFPYYLFNKMFAKRAMEMQRHEPVESEEDVGHPRKIRPILPSTNWRKFQAHKYLESWGKTVSEDFPEDGLYLDNFGNLSPDYGDGVRGPGRRSR